MKNSKLILGILFLSLITFSLSGYAQNFRTKIAYLNTTDSTGRTVLTVPIASDEAGILNVKFLGYAQDNAGAVTSIQAVRYLSASGTITLGTPSVILPLSFDGSLTNSAVAFVVSGSNILLQVKAGRPVPVRWQLVVEKESRVKNN